MKIKKLFFICAINILIINVVASINSTANIFVASEELKWQVEEQNKFIWTVIKSNGTYYYYPLNSKFELEINSISVISTNVSDINATLTAFNSSSGLIDYQLNNETYNSFNATSLSFTHYQRFADIGFIIPINYKDRFYEALNNSYESHPKFNESGYSLVNGQIEKFWTYSINRDQHLLWEFTDGYMTKKFTVIEDNQIIHQVELKINEEIINDDDDDDMENNDNMLTILIFSLIIGSIAASTIILLKILKKKGVILKNKTKIRQEVDKILNSN